ncbi:DUF3667 domain-containing protein [Larkinella soli]|uniref:DUF3667 domain-containing protein n=1 Tax=Larkinella soli TaxID=1770527 RepID=UPI000FFC30D9|nr:DUF3667 domain-containing protein [Larkinella soli]
MSLTLVKQCPNCRTGLESEYNYCPACGQTTHLHRFNLHHIFHEVFHALTHADKGVIHLVKELTIRPGVVAREYILEGKRKKYFNPFTFLVLIVGLTIFVNSIVHPYTRSSDPVGQAAGREYRTEQERQQKLKVAERIRTSQQFLEKRGNVIIFLAIPIVTLTFWLLFFRSGVNYAEHLVAQVFFTGYYSLITSLVFTPLRPLFPNANAFAGTQILFQLVYITFAYYQFLPPNRPKSVFRVALATLAALMTWAVVSFAAMYLYIRFG